MEVGMNNYSLSRWLVADRFTPEMIHDDEIAIHAENSTEDRGRVSVWDEVRKVISNRCISIMAPTPTRIEDLLEATFEAPNGNRSRIALRADSQIERSLGGGNLFIDVSGLPHHIWAALLRFGVAKGLRVRIMYIEPRHYRYHRSPSSNSFFDLSEGNLGLSPLPGLASLDSDQNSSQRIFVPLLGFEGTRALYLQQQLDPEPPRTVPVVGVPGFRAEYPSIAIACNLDFLDEVDAYSDVRTVPASDVFGVMDTIAEIEREHPGKRLLIAPVGTKPHAVGAVLYAIRHRSAVELLYDNPIKRPQRTSGIGKVHIYTVA
jgi:hypothetical protein